MAGLKFFTQIFVPWPGPLPGLLQIIVCLAAIGFQFDDLKSWVMFIYVFHSILLGFKALFPYDYDEFAKDGHGSIVSFNAFIQIVLQSWSSVQVSIFVSKMQFNEKTHTIISSFVVLFIEWILLGIMCVKIYRQRDARKSKYSSEKRFNEVRMSLIQNEDTY